MLRVLILNIPEIRAWQESEFLEQGFGFQSGHCSRKAIFLTLQGQILTSFEVQKFPTESFSNKYWFIFSLSFRVNCNSPSLSCPCILSYGCQFILVPLIVRKAPKSLTLLETYLGFEESVSSLGEEHQRTEHFLFVFSNNSRTLSSQDNFDLSTFWPLGGEIEYIHLFLDHF